MRTQVEIWRYEFRLKPKYKGPVRLTPFMVSYTIYMTVEPNGRSSNSTHHLII